VFAQNYGQAGAIDLYGRALVLPVALSGHNSYALWGWRGCSGEVLIVIGAEREEIEPIFDEVTAAATYRCADCMPYEANKTIWVARGRKQSASQLWRRLRHLD
jgi:hypothetical protein